MKFSLKVFLLTTVVVVLSLSMGGYLLISSLFQSALQREISVAIEENRMLRFSYEAVLSSAPSGGKGEFLQTISERIGANTNLRIYTTEDEVAYENTDIQFDGNIFASVSEESRAYQIHRVADAYYLQTVCIMGQSDGEGYYFETIREISDIFLQRQEQFRSFQRIMLIMTSVGGVISYLFSYVLTRPIERLSKTTRKIAEGNISRRARITSGDEIGDLARDFNKMADEVEERIHSLEDMNRRQEDFVASFAHELKTPLTSIIGYGDMLRSRTLAPEDQFIAADYIFREGKRLESLSLKLLELIVLKREDFERRATSAAFLFSRVEAFMLPILKDTHVEFRMQVEDAQLRVEADLFQTLIINLLDNARKAVGERGTIQLIGRREDEGFAVYVVDSGTGIPKGDLPNITEAFYRADKSRSREQGGAGLGLAICSEIINLHHGEIHIQSEEGKGTVIRVYLKEVSEDEQE